VTKSGQVEDLIEALIKKAKIQSEDDGGRIRLYETSNHKFFRELERSYPVISINDYTQVVAERIPEEELDIKDSTHFISVFQFQAEPSRSHGMPFKFLLKEVSLATGLGWSLDANAIHRVRSSRIQKSDWRSGLA
jgi:ubiquitin carboxyl-terminal hydrolase 7